MATVLYVTPDSTLGELALQNLPKVGYDIALARGGMEALRALYATTVDVLVLDTAIADVPVADLCDRLRQDPTWQSVPVVFLAPGS
ncbi:MAG: hypothetical protein ACE5KW_00735, partial [Dehalococcoidia bacterium]